MYMLGSTIWLKFCSCETTHLNWQDLKQCAGDPDAFDNQEGRRGGGGKENDPTIDPDDDKNEKAGKGLESDSRSSGSGKNTTEPAAAVEPNTEPAQVETAETKVEKKVDEQVKAKDEEKVSDKKKKSHDSKEGDNDESSKADSAGTDLAKGPTDEKPKEEEPKPTGEGT